MLPVDAIVKFWDFRTIGERPSAPRLAVFATKGWNMMHPPSGLSRRDLLSASRPAALWRRRRSALLAAGTAASLVFMQLPAASDQSPPGCTSNDPVLNITKDRTYVRNGDTITYHVEVHNLATPTGAACDFSSATVAITVPAPDGTPTGPRTVLAEALDLPAGTGLTQFKPVTWVVNLNPGVEDAVVKADVTGIIHDAPTNHNALVVKTLGTTVTNALTELSVVPNPASGQVPLRVTYTYTEKNVGNAPIKDVVMTDDVCSPITLVSGDQGNDQILGVGETWTLTCTTTLSTPGTVTNHVKSTGNNAQDNRPHPEENAQATVTVRPQPTVLAETVPPPPPPAPKVPKELPRTF
jgi:uncharacterized repeat protein (TIGR01451 family)